jgi:ATP-dependent Clp protease ATP-binding subunit ClpA
MFERFDEDARSAVVRARAETVRTGHAEIGTEQLLAGLAAGPGLAADVLTAAGIGLAELRALTPAGDGAARLEPLDAEALASIGIDLDTVSRATDAAFGPGSLTRTRARRRVRRRRRGGPRMAEGTKAVFALALHAALRFGHNHVSSGHLLLGLLDQPASPAVATLRAAGADISALRQQATAAVVRAGDRGGAPEQPGA